MPPSMGHGGSLNSLTSMEIMWIICCGIHSHLISTQLKTYRRFWTEVSEIAFLHHQNTNDGISSGRIVFHPLHTCFFPPLICHPSVSHWLIYCDSWHSFSSARCLLAFLVWPTSHLLTCTRQVLLPILQPASGGQSKYSGCTFGEPSCPS